MFELLIRNAVIYDGTGAEPYVGSLAVRGGKIEAVGADVDGPAERTVEADGLSLSPGFIDAHSHADGSIFENPQRVHVLRMGVTTEVCGNCGIALSPVAADADETILSTLCGSSSYRPRFFRRFSEELRAMDALPLGTNLAVFTGHVPLRYSVMTTENRAPDARELETMQRMLAEAMEDGALGYTTGLSYVPGIYSKTDELAALASVTAPYGGIYSTHSRSESAGLFASVQECIDIARTAGVRVNISHFKCVGRTFWPRCGEALAMIDRANAAGLDVAIDAYPYTACATSTTSAIPARFLDRGPAAFARSLENPAVVEAIRREIYEIDDPGWDNSALHVGLENFLITGAEQTPEFVGMTYAEAGKKLGVSPFEAMIRILRRNDARVRDVRYAMCEENVEQILRHPRCVVGADGTYAVGRDAITHPRALGTFPRYLGRYIRDRKLLTRQEGVRRVTGMTADRFGLRGKGYLKPGFDADLVLFDFERILDRADYLHPFLPNEGIHQVYQGGRLVLQDDAPTGVFAGRTLPRNDRR